MSVQPHFRIMCNHGNLNGQLDHVAWLPWMPSWFEAADLPLGRQDWWFLNGDADHVELIDLDGDRRVDWSPMRSMWDKGFVSEEPTRRAFEIPCRWRACTVWAYRSDYDELQKLLARIATDASSPCDVCGKQPFVETVESNDHLVVMTIEELRQASRHTTGKCGVRA